VSSASSSTAPLPQRVFQRLDDRSFVSGESLAADLSVTRAAIWKSVEQLRELGVALDAQTSKGYRLAPGVSALSLVEWTLESTNTRLLEALPPAAGTAAVVMAENQTGGRGRRGRGWVAPPGGAICLSLGWQYADMPPDLSALSLIVGLCAVNSLTSLGVRGVSLKWPNDLVTAEGKLGGILIEMRAESGGPVHVVAGIGLNVALDDQARATVKTTGNIADDIRAHCSPVPDRNAIVAALLARLVPALDGFPRHGLTPYLENWHEYDALHGKEVRVENAGEITRGMARGIDTHGALLVENPGGVQRFISGEVTVRIDT
jgi:BirA family transcriptional regulator, biotin operon repressor / biotin---[acetyl-CoA-carboxylase] ligase